MKASDIHVPVLNDPYWRVTLRSDSYDAELIPTLKDCFEVIEKTKVRLRGWDYPHLGYRESERGQGSNWIASWSDFMDHREYWRLFQSGQFLHLFSVSEFTRSEWKQQLALQLQGHLGNRYGDLAIPGYISIINFLYTVTEIFEFASRLTQATGQKGEVEISIRLNGIKGFALVAEWGRSWYNLYVSGENELGHVWTIPTGELFTGSADFSLNAVMWFFERFGWMNPSKEVLLADQQQFLAGKR